MDKHFIINKILFIDKKKDSSLAPSVHSEDVLVLLKALVWNSHEWSLEHMAEELGHSVDEVGSSLNRLRLCGLIESTSNKISTTHFQEFLLFGIQYLFPVKPGKIIRGMLTGAKPGMFFTSELPYTSIWVWPHSNFRDQGYEITPLSPQCCFAALNDSKLRNLLAITETLRVAGREARPWASEQLKKFL